MTLTTTSRALADLRGVRLGRHERALLLAAPRAGAFEADGVVTGGLAIAVDEPNRSGREAVLRASRKLADLGLIVHRTQRAGERRVHIALTELGAVVVERYWGELESGRRIRWADQLERGG